MGEKTFRDLDERFVLNGTSIRLLHYTQGKSSRARGNIWSTAYLSFDDIELKNKFMAMVPSKVPLLNPEEYGDQQPLVISSIFQKSLKQKVRVDRLEGTYEKDPEFINFVAASEAPMIKLLSAEQQLEEIEKAAAVLEEEQKAAMNQKSKEKNGKE